MHKTKLRKSVLNERDSLSEVERNKRNLSIFQNFIRFSETAKVDIYFVYISFRSEVDTKELISYLLKEKKEVYVPVTDLVNKVIFPVKINEDTVYKPGAYGILEPISNEKKEYVDPSIFQCVITPGAVFDRSGGRIGYGGGFYDKFFDSASEDVLKVSFAYSFQVMSVIPQEKHDVSMNFVVTENEIIST